MTHQNPHWNPAGIVHESLHCGKVHGNPCIHIPGHCDHDGHLPNHPINVYGDWGGAGNGYGVVGGEGPSPFVNSRNVWKQHIKKVGHKMAGTNVPTMSIPPGPYSDGLLTTRMVHSDRMVSNRSDRGCPRSDITRNPDGFGNSDVECRCTRCAHLVAIEARYEIGDWWWEGDG